jgi:hypothetical protein
MKKKLGLLPFLMLLITIVLLGFSIDSISSLIHLLPYIMLSVSFAIGFTLIYFFSLNEIDHKFLKFLVLLISFIPVLIPVLFLFELIIFENYSTLYAFLTLIQIGFSILSASLFFSDHVVRLSNILTLSSALCCFILAGMVITEIPLIGSLAFSTISFVTTSILFLSGLILGYKKIN